MFKRRNKNKAEATTTEPSAFDKTEAKVKAEIARIEKISDPAERLLEYKALKASSEKLYSEDKVIKFTGMFGPGGDTEQEYIKETRNGLSFLGAVIGFCIGAVTLTGLSAGLALPLAGALVIGGFFTGRKLGKKWGKADFEKRHTAEQKFATRMHETTRGIGASVFRLTSYFKQDAGLKALKQSPRCEDVKKAFPEIAAEFNRQAARDAFVAQPPSTPANTGIAKLAA